MPIYEFRCEACDADFEQLFRTMSARAPVHCPSCGGAKVSRKLSLFGMSTRGSDGARRSSGSGCASCRASSCAGCRK